MVGKKHCIVVKLSKVFGKVQLSSWEISNTGLIPRPPRSRFLLITWQIICTLDFSNGFCVGFFFHSANPHVCRELSFILASTDESGIALPLPPGLGPLPLFPANDGFYSVLGPSLSLATSDDQATASANNPFAYRPSASNIPATLKPPKRKVFCGSSKCPGNKFAPSPTVYPSRD